MRAAVQTRAMLREGMRSAFCDLQRQVGWLAAQHESGTTDPVILCEVFQECGDTQRRFVSAVFAYLMTY